MSPRKHDLDAPNGWSESERCEWVRCKSTALHFAEAVHDASTSQLSLGGVTHRTIAPADPALIPNQA